MEEGLKAAEGTEQEMDDGTECSRAIRIGNINCEKVNPRRNSGMPFYEPMLEQAMIKRLQAAPIGPDPPAILQCESTASSGRRAIVVIRGDLYGFLEPCSS